MFDFTEVDVSDDIAQDDDLEKQSENDLYLVTEELRKEQNKLEKIFLRILYLETMNHITKGDFTKSFSMVYKYPFCFDKFKLLTALLLPKFALKKIKNYFLITIKYIFI